MPDLNGLKVAILVDNGFEQVEMTEPRSALDGAGAETVLISPQKDQVKGWKFKEWGDKFPVDERLSDADPGKFDALVLPGGVMNPDHLRMNPQAVQFVRAFFDADKPVAAICHGPWTIIEAGAAEGKRIAAWPSLKTDIRNAGGEWEDREVMVDGKLVSSRNPDDLPAFKREMLNVFEKAAVKAKAAGQS
jgi:protease I